MRRFGRFIPLLALILLTACDRSDRPDATTSAAPDSGQSAASAPQSTDPVPDAHAPASLAGRELRIAVENGYLPFNYRLLGQNQAQGWDYEAWQAICERLDCRPRFVERAWLGTLEAVASGEVDTSGNGVSITPERAGQLAFSEPYFQSSQRLLVRREDPTQNADEILAGEETLGAQAGTTNADLARSLVAADRVLVYDTLAELLSALSVGDLAAVVLDEQAAPGDLAAETGEFRFLGDSLASERLAFPFQKGSELLGPVNQALAQMVADGTLARLERRYFSSEFDLGYEQIQLPESDAVPFDQADELAGDGPD